MQYGPAECCSAGPFGRCVLRPHPFSVFRIGYHSNEERGEMMRCRPPRHGRDSTLSLCCMAFGLGMLLALCGELRTALLFAAAGLVVLGFRCRR